jgi:hypothetical protein
MDGLQEWRVGEGIWRSMENRGPLERHARRCRSMTCSPVIGRKVVDILQHFRLSAKSLRVYAIS